MSHPTPRTLRLGLMVLVAAGYLLLAHLTTAPDRPSALGALIAILPLMLFGFVMAWRSSRAALGLWLAGVAALAWAWPLLEARFEWVYFIQHVGAFSLLAIVFARTLANGEVPMITRFARLAHGASLAPELLPYTRAVTVAWTLFFAAMAIASLLLFTRADLAHWSLLVNLLTPLLVGLMFAGEFGVRLLVLPPAVRTGFVESIQAGIAAARGLHRDPSRLAP